jgi:hypothetical protein
MRLSDMTGSVIKTINICTAQKTIELMMNSLLAGVYFISVDTAADKAIKKIIRK